LTPEQYWCKIPELGNLTAEQRWVKTNTVGGRHRKCCKLYDCYFGLYRV
jgi:hypothetical protein